MTKIPEGYSRKTATERRPLFGWNCPGDVMRAEKYLKDAAKIDRDLAYQDDYIEKLRGFGIHPDRTVMMIRKAWPVLIDKMFLQETFRRVFMAYTDATDLPGENASGERKREQASDGSWDVRYSGTVLKVLKEWQCIIESMQFIHDDGLLKLSDRQFERKFGKLTPKSIISQIDRGKVPMKRFARQVYIPKSPPVLKHQGQTVFNIWRPSGLEPDFGDHQWFLDHVAIMFPDKASAQHLLDYMAQLVQHPEVKIHFAILLQSIEGAGKGALARILRRIIGYRNCVEPSNDDVVSKYSGWQEGTQLAIINELMADGRLDVLNRLKSPITEDTLRIEKKFGNAFTIPNHMNLFCMTNFKDALPITEGDRRWLVLFSPAAKQSKSYYARLFANIADDLKVAAVMGYLMDHEITFDPKAPAPWTAAKGDMQERAKPDAQADLQTMFDAQQPPFDQPLVRVADIVSWVRMDRKNERNVHRHALAFLDHVKAAKLRRYKHGKEGLPAHQLYAIRDHAKWTNGEPIDVALAYQAQYMTGDDGDNADDWDR
jgi:hypothetical protein